MPEGQVLDRENGAAEAADGIDGERAGGPMAALAALPGLLGGALEDIRAIATGMAVLPELARILAKIETRVDRLDDEVMKMRRAVESMGADVGSLPTRLEELQDSIPLSRKSKKS